MAKTEVILTHNIVGLGGESDQVRVASGYARNYLIPQRLAIPVTQANKRHLEALKQRGQDLAVINGDEGARELPIPGTFIIDRTGIIEKAYADSDHTYRIDPDEIIDYLKSR